jgi:sulfatase modifying factor 1
MNERRGRLLSEARHFESAKEETMKTTAMVLLAMAVCTWGVGAQADVVIDTVTVGNPGNTGELSGAGAGGFGPDRICGAVDYVYNIGKFEVTAGQYTEFLNSVAADDTYDLYHEWMWDSDYGCNIQRSGSPGKYAYSVAPDWANRAVNYVSWADAARFCNWLHNGQPDGNQDLSTTEDGSYHLNGAMGWEELLAVTREPDATWVIPSEDEWYKAAYHKNDGATGNYFFYSTSTDGVPSNELIDPDPGNNANFWDADYTIGGPYWRTEIGEFENSESRYGTFDQGGNLWEWDEGVLYGLYRCLRGGSFYSIHAHDLHAADRYNAHPPYEGLFIFGFRVAKVGGCVGDLDGDGDTDQSDLGILLGDWGCDDPVNGCAGDLDGDDHTDQADLGILLADWGCVP